MFRLCTRYVSTVLEVCFERARGMHRPCSRYDSIVHEVCFDRARVMFRRCSRCVSTVLEVSFGRRSWYVSTAARSLLDHARVLFASMLETCFDRPQSMFWPSSRYVPTDMRYFRPCMRYVLTVLEVCFNRAWSMFRRCTSHVLTVARGMFQPCSGYVSTAYEVCFDLALDLFQLSLEVCFYRARVRFST